MARRLELPGFFDLQINGFAGVDFNAPGVSQQQVDEVSAALRRTGVTRYLPTFITCHLETFRSCVAPWLETQDPAVAGFHLEGPYINSGDGPRGAHESCYVAAPSLDDFLRRHEAAQGRVRLVTLAPEVPGALRLIEGLVELGICVAIGHSMAERQHVLDAVSAGARMSTHLGNATPRTVDRYNNVIWQQLARDELTAGLILDGHHLDADTAKVMVRAKSPRRVVLVSDAMAAGGMAPGNYTLGDIQVNLSADGRAVRADNGRLAGSALTLDRAVGMAVRFAGVSLEEAAQMASQQPAALLGEVPQGTLEVEWCEDSHRLTVLCVRDAGEG